jgi:hypothetical protein
VPLVYVSLLFDMQLAVFVKYLSLRISRVCFLIVYFALVTIVTSSRSCVSSLPAACQCSSRNSCIGVPEWSVIDS